ncbi:MAG TPA: FadR/GntR family transcriptional regulator, partial [Spirochaetales bacterium]|nr:FadR/GntR family transcriptional regulator [Spirochaetales bacterium]
MKSFDIAGGPLRGRSLKDEFIERFEALILSGRFAAGEKLPGERELGELFGVSRPVIHEGLRALETRGLVSIESRKGVRVNDWRREGSIELLLSLLSFSGGKLSEGIFEGLLEMRLLFETETARLAASRAGPEQLAALAAHVEREGALDPLDTEAVVAADYEFHLQVALASGNEIYPLLMNSFRRVYEGILASFYSLPSVVGRVFRLHRAFVSALSTRDGEKARRAMLDILEFGEAGLRRVLAAADGEAAAAP